MILTRRGCVEEGHRLWHAQVECVTFGAPMIGDSKLSEEITRLEWGASITNIVTRHDIVPRILLAAWKGSKIAGLGALLVACKGMEKPGERRQELPAEQEGLSGLVYKACCRVFCCAAVSACLIRCIPLTAQHAQRSSHLLTS